MRLLLFLLTFSTACANINFIDTIDNESIVKLSRTSDGGTGTGFQVRAPSGKLYLLTNHHICRSDKVLTTTSNKGIQTSVKVIARYDKHDLCLVEPLKNVKPIGLAMFSFPEQQIAIVGYPYAGDLDMETGRYMLYEYIEIDWKCKHNKLKPSCPETLYSGYVTAYTYIGNSGSPVLNKSGKVVGVIYANTFGKPELGGSLVPLKAIYDFLKDK